MREREYKPLQKLAYDHIKKLITENVLEYGRIYSESKIALEINISRTPVRDSVHRLYQEGYIEIVPNKGFMLHRIDEKDVYEINEVRTAIEGYCARRLAKERGEPGAAEAIRKMEEVLEKQREIFRSSGLVDGFVEYDNLFHWYLVSYTGNEAFIDLIERYTYKIKELSRASLAHADRMEATIREHTAILEAIRQGDVKGADEAVIIHMDTPLEIKLKEL